MDKEPPDEFGVGGTTKSEFPAVKDTGEFLPPEGRAQIIVLSGTGTGRKYSVTDTMAIGRHPESDICIADEGVSRHHARIEKSESGDYLIRDLGSRNGTLVNGVVIAEKTTLSFGDRITVGTQTTLALTYADPMEEQLLHLQKMEAVGRLAAGVAHEFNNLLAVVLTNLSLLESVESMEPEERRACFSEAKQAATRGAELTRRMLDFSRISPVDVEPTDVSALVGEVHQFIKKTFTPSISVDAHITPDLYVLGDKLQIYQVLVNLCLNARDALSGSGTIHLKVEVENLEGRDLERLSRLHRGRHVVLTVQDSGPGIKAEDMDKVFEPFFTTKTAGQGTGLGLSVVHGIVHSHCGEIAINSRRGATTVKVYLPAISHVQEPVERLTVDVHRLKMTGTVLLVDDDELVLGSLRRMLQSSGFDVVATADGSEAVDLFKERQDSIDVVVLDVIMPVMGGQEIFRLLKEIDPSVKVLFSSGYIGEDVASELLDAGAYGFLKKPYEPERLTSSILEALNTDRPDA